MSDEHKINNIPAKIGYQAYPENALKLNFGGKMVSMCRQGAAPSTKKKIRRPFSFRRKFKPNRRVNRYKKRYRKKSKPRRRYRRKFYY